MHCCETYNANGELQSRICSPQACPASSGAVTVLDFIVEDCSACPPVSKDDSSTDTELLQVREHVAELATNVGELTARYYQLKEKYPELFEEPGLDVPCGKKPPKGL